MAALLSTATLLLWMVYLVLGILAALALTWIVTLLAYGFRKISEEFDARADVHDTEFARQTKDVSDAAWEAFNATSLGVGVFFLSIVAFAQRNAKWVALIGILSAGAIVIAAYEPEGVAMVTLMYNCGIKEVLRYAFVPAMNIARIVFDTVIAGWNAYLQFYNMIVTQWAITVLKCGWMQVQYFVVHLSNILIYFISGIVTWITSNPMITELDMYMVGVEAARAVTDISYAGQCVCKTLAPFIRILGDIPQDEAGRLVNSTVNVVYNVLWGFYGNMVHDLITSGGKTVTPEHRPDPTLITEQLANFVVALGDLVDAYYVLLCANLFQFVGENGVVKNLYGAVDTGGPDGSPWNCKVVPSQADTATASLGIDPWQVSYWNTRLDGVAMAQSMATGVPTTPRERRTSQSHEALLEAATRLGALTQSQDVHVNGRRKPLSHPSTVDITRARRDVVYWSGPYEPWFPGDAVWASCDSDLLVTVNISGTLTNETCDVVCNVTASSDPTICLSCDADTGTILCGGICVLPPVRGPEIPDCDDELCPCLLPYCSSTCMCPVGHAPPDCMSCTEDYIQCGNFSVAGYTWPICNFNRTLQQLPHQYCPPCGTSGDCACEKGWAEPSCRRCAPGYTQCIADGGDVSCRIDSVDALCNITGCEHCDVCHDYTTCVRCNVTAGWVPYNQTCVNATTVCTDIITNCDSCNAFALRCDVCSDGYALCKDTSAIGGPTTRCVPWDCPDGLGDTHCNPCNISGLPVPATCPIGYVPCATDVDGEMCFCALVSGGGCTHYQLCGRAESIGKNENATAGLGSDHVVKPFGIIGRVIAIPISFVGWVVKVVFRIDLWLWKEDAHSANIDVIMARAVDLVNATARNIGEVTYSADLGHTFQYTLQGFLNVFNLLWEFVTVWVFGQRDVLTATYATREIHGLNASVHLPAYAVLMETVATREWARGSIPSLVRVRDHYRDLEHAAKQAEAQGDIPRRDILRRNIASALEDRAREVMTVVWSHGTPTTIKLMFDTAIFHLKQTIAPASKFLADFLSGTLKFLIGIGMNIMDFITHAERVFTSKYFATNIFPELVDLLLDLEEAMDGVFKVFYLTKTEGGWSVRCNPATNAGDLFCHTGLMFSNLFHAIIDIVEIVIGFIAAVIDPDYFTAHPNVFYTPFNDFLSIKRGTAFNGIDTLQGHFPDFVGNFAGVVGAFTPWGLGDEIAGAIDGAVYRATCGATPKTTISVVESLNRAFARMLYVVTIPSQFVWELVIGTVWSSADSNLDFTAEGLVDVVNIVMALIRPVISTSFGVTQEWGYFFVCASNGGPSEFDHPCTGDWSSPKVPSGCFFVEVAQLLAGFIETIVKDFLQLFIYVFSFWMHILSGKVLGKNSAATDLQNMAELLKEQVIYAILHGIDDFWLHIVPASWKSFLLDFQHYDTKDPGICQAQMIALKGLRDFICDSVVFKSLCGYIPKPPDRCPRDRRREPTDDPLIVRMTDYVKYGDLDPHKPFVSYWARVEIAEATLAQAGKRFVTKNHDAFGDMTSGAHMLATLAGWSTGVVDFSETPDLFNDPLMRNLTDGVISKLQWNGQTTCDRIVHDAQGRDFITDLTGYERYDVLRCGLLRFIGLQLSGAGAYVDVSDGETRYPAGDFPTDFFYNIFTALTFSWDVVQGGLYALVDLTGGKYDRVGTYVRAGLYYPHAVGYFLGTFIDAWLQALGSFAEGLSIQQQRSLRGSGTLPAMERAVRTVHAVEDFLHETLYPSSPTGDPDRTLLPSQEFLRQYGAVRPVDDLHLGKMVMIMRQRQYMTVALPSLVKEFTTMQNPLHIIEETMRQHRERSAAAARHNARTADTLMRRRRGPMMADTPAPQAIAEVAQTSPHSGCPGCKGSQLWDGFFHYHPSTVALGCRFANALHPIGKDGVPRGFCCALIDDVICTIEAIVEGLGYYYGTVYPESISAFSDFFTGSYYGPNDTVVTSSWFGGIAAFNRDYMRAMMAEHQTRQYMYRLQHGGVTPQELAMIAADLPPCPPGPPVTNGTLLPCRQYVTNTNATTTPPLYNVYNKTLATRLAEIGYIGTTRNDTKRISTGQHSHYTHNVFVRVMNFFTQWLFGVSFAEWLDDLAYWMLNINTELPPDGSLEDVGFLYWAEQFMVCHWRYDCKFETGGRNMSLGRALVYVGVVYAIGMMFINKVTGSSQTAAEAAGSPVARMLGFGFVFSFVPMLLFVAYRWSPYCAWFVPELGMWVPGAPTCVADDMMELAMRYTPNTLPLPDGFITFRSGSHVGTDVCGPVEHVTRCSGDYFPDTFYTVMYAIELWVPGLANATRSWLSAPLYGRPLTWLFPKNSLSAYVDRFAPGGAHPITNATERLCWELSFFNIFLVFFVAMLLGLALYLLVYVVVPLMYSSARTIQASVISTTYNLSHVTGGGLRRMATNMRAALVERWARLVKRPHTD